MIYLSIALLPLIQVGFNWWIGVSLIIILLIISSLNFQTISIKHQLFIYIACVGMFLETVINSGFESRAGLRVSREILCLLLIVYSMGTLMSARKSFNIQLFKTILACMSGFLLALTMIQFIAIREGRNITLPESWYPRTLLLATQIDFTYSNVRPSATFTEPSYLGLISFSMMCLGYYMVKHRMKGESIFYMNFLTICISQSKAGIFFGILLIFYRIKNPLTELNQKTSKSLNRNFPIFIAFCLVLVVYFNTLRLDESSSVADRLMHPASIILRYVYNFPFGIPYYERLNSNIFEDLSETWVAISHNGYINLIFDYGFLGFILVAILFSNSKKDFQHILLLIFLGIQNGGLLDFDKVALYFVVKSSCDSIYKFRPKT